jgi:hypothetical protein
MYGINTEIPALLNQVKDRRAGMTDTTIKNSASIFYDFLSICAYLPCSIFFILLLVSPDIIDFFSLSANPN